MNKSSQIKSIWENIQQNALQEQCPPNKKRGLIREYLQCEFLCFLYEQK